MVTTDFGRESERAFFHALAFTVRAQGRLTLLHTGPESHDSIRWEKFPGVRETLANWELLPKDAPRAAVAATLNVGVAKMVMRDDDPRQGITDYLRRNPTDLLVMTTEGRTGLARLFNPSVAETVCFRTRSPTLMLPKSGPELVDPKSGRCELRRVLCALDPYRDPGPTLGFLRRWLPAIGEPGMEVTILQNCDPNEAAELELPADGGLGWQQEVRPGEAVETIVSTARDLKAEMVVMTTRGLPGVIGRVHGSHIDRVLRDLRLPLLTVPTL